MIVELGDYVKFIGIVFGVWVVKFLVVVGGYFYFDVYRVGGDICFCLFFGVYCEVIGCFD